MMGASRTQLGAFDYEPKARKADGTNMPATLGTFQGATFGANGFEGIDSQFAEDPTGALLESERTAMEGQFPVISTGKDQRAWEDVTSHGTSSLSEFNIPPEDYFLEDSGSDPQQSLRELAQEREALQREESDTSSSPSAFSRGGGGASSASSIKRIINPGVNISQYLPEETKQQLGGQENGKYFLKEEEEEELSSLLRDVRTPLKGFPGAMKLKRYNHRGKAIYTQDLPALTGESKALLDRARAKAEEAFDALDARKNRLYSNHNHTAAREQSIDLLKGFQAYQKRPQHVASGITGHSKPIDSFEFVDGPRPKLYIALENLQEGLTQHVATANISVYCESTLLNITISTVALITEISQGGHIGVIERGERLTYYWCHSLSGDILPFGTRWRLKNGILFVELSKKHPGITWERLIYKSVVPEQLIWKGNDESDVDPLEEPYYFNKVLKMMDVDD